MAKKPFEDDGRTIADMDIDGMPWHDRRIRREKRAAKKTAQAEQIQLTRKERRAVILGVSSAVLMIIAIVFVAYFLLFIFFDIAWS